MQKYFPDFQKSDSYERLVGQVRNYIHGSMEMLNKNSNINSSAPQRGTSVERM